MSRLERKDAPLVRVGSQGRVSRNLESLADIYRKSHPGMEVRWVYDPQHRPELSQVTSRQADGYQLVFGRDIEGDNLHLEPDKPVRHSDVVLMCIEEPLKTALAAERVRYAQEDLASIDRNFYDAIEEIDPGTKNPLHKPRPRGRTTIEERTHEWEVKQREGDLSDG